MRLLAFAAVSLTSGLLLATFSLTGLLAFPTLALAALTFAGGAFVMRQELVTNHRSDVLAARELAAYLAGGAHEGVRGELGGARLVLPDQRQPDRPLPFEVACGGVLDRAAIGKLDRGRVAEISQLAVVARYRRRPGEADRAFAIDDDGPYDADSDAGQVAAYFIAVKPYDEEEGGSGGGGGGGCSAGTFAPAGLLLLAPLLLLRRRG